MTGLGQNDKAARLLAQAGAIGKLPHTVSGTVVFDYGLPASGIVVRAYNCVYGGEDSLLVENETDGTGAYDLSYSAADPVNLELRTVDAAGAEITLSATRFGVAAEATLDLVAPASVRPLAPEFDRLTADLTKATGTANAIGAAQEGDGRKDLSILRNATGWDARLLALASTATALSKTIKVPADALYGLFRTGLPTDPARLARVDGKVIDQALTRAADTGLIGRAAVERARDAIAQFARGQRRAATAPGAVSSMGDLLAATGLTAQQQSQWEDIYFSTPSDKLWATAAKALGVDAATTLQTQGKLSGLTLNNAPLMKAVQPQANGELGLAGLVDAGFYKADFWEKTLRASVNGNELEAAIPTAYAAAATDDRLSAYTEDMARKVRLAFPTRVVGHMLESGELKLGGSGAKAGTFLKQASEQGLELGRVPVDQILKGTPSDDVADAVRTIQRVFQITPSNDHMQTLFDADLLSAKDVTTYSAERFLALHGDKFKTPGDADLVYRKATQVSSITYGLFTSARALDSSTPVAAISGGADTRQAAKDGVIKQYPTMEQLFGSLDFCECAECRSVLSPAAYLVDLLQFINEPDLVWTAFTTEWNGAHTEHFPGDLDKPFTQLDARRPDLKSLPLTCENTNTALPYIDIVNEILEYDVVHGGLAGDAGNDTGDVTSQELLAEPQYILSAAYDTLLSRAYPIGLPFDLWLETVRAFLGYLGVPLTQLLETFRASDDLFRPQAGTAPYYRAQIFAESLGITPAQWAIYTNPASAASWWTLYGYGSDGEARTALTSAKTLSQRLSVSYEELVSVLESGFVNPQLAKLVGLSKIGIDVGQVYRYENAPGAAPLSAGELTAMEQQLADFETATGFDAKAWVNARYADHTFDSIIVLADPDPGCDFDHTTLQYADGDPVTDVDWVKINLFVRLWRKLGWKIDELDSALCALLPPSASTPTAANLGPALGTAILYLAHLSALSSDLSLGPGARLKLPTLWGDISTTGAGSLYAQLFLTPSARRNDGVFDDPVGDYLHDNTKLLADHRTAVQAALTLTARDVDAILADAAIDPATAPLSLANVSALYRYGLLARALKLSVTDLIALKTLSGLDPFAPIEPAPLNSDPAQVGGVSPIADDHPFSQTLAFADVARRVAASGFSIAELQYLLVHDPDSVARFRADEAPALALMQSLRAEIDRIRSDNSPPADPTTLDDDTLRQKLALVLPGPVVDTFMAMWSQTVEFTATPEAVTPGDALDPSALADVLSISVSYDAVTQEQRLTFTGVLLAAQRTSIETTHPGGVLSGLLGDVQDQARAFYDRWCPAFLQPADYDTLFTPIPTAPVAAQTAIAARRAAVCAGLFPYLQARLIRQLVVNSLAATLTADPVLVDALISDATLLYDPAAGPGTPLLDAFAAAADPGLTAEWFASGDLSGATLVTPAPAIGNADTQVKPATTKSARLSGCLQVTDTGPYRFFVDLDKQNAGATLRFEHLADPVIAAEASADGAELSARVDLKAGVPYPFTLELTALGAGDARMLVQGETLPKSPLDAVTLYPRAVLDRVRRADVVMAKTLRLLAGFGLQESELAHLLTHGADFSGLDLSAFPADATTAGAPARFEQFLRLAGYAALKAALALDGDDLIDVFAHARRAYTGALPQVETDLLADLSARVAALTRRDADTIAQVAAQIGYGAGSSTAGIVEAPDFAQERGLQRLWDALSLLETLGVPADAIPRWVPIVDGAAPARDSIADDVKNTVKARFEDTAWYQIAQPTFDSIRKLKRDALVAYVVDKQGFDSPDRIYEHYLLDPEMQPVVQTSRIQAAIASVQLFVQRCLLNLENRVPPPAIIDADSWDWMKRYTLWEANRRIFLYPENWLEPEFRDDKTSLFTDLEGSLLQGDVTSDAAENAFLAYLQSLEAIARLQIVSMFVEEPDDAVDILHVIARTYSAPHKYYYRQFTDMAWTSWTPVDVEVDGDHVAAVKWRNRLHLFWVTFADKSTPKDQTQSPRNLADTAVQDSNQAQVELRLSWSALVDGSWTPRASGPPFTVIKDNVSSTFDRTKVPIFVTIETRADGTEGAVRVHLGGEVQQAFRIATRNSPPTVLGDGTSPPTNYYSANVWNATTERGTSPLSVHYVEEVGTTLFGLTLESTETTQQILGAAPEGPFDLLLGDTQLRLPRADLAPLAGPFFYEDEANAFFVAPEVHEDTIDVWEKWVVDDGPSIVQLPDLNWWVNVPVVPQVPWYVPVGPDPGDPWPLYDSVKQGDWLTDPSTILQFDGSFLGAQGGVDIAIAGAATADGRAGTVVLAGAGSAIGAGTSLTSLARGASAAITEGADLRIVGAAGINSVAFG